MASSSLLLSASSKLLQLRAANSNPATLPARLHLINYFSTNGLEHRTQARFAHLAKANLKSVCRASLSEVAKAGESFAKVRSATSTGAIPADQLLKVVETAAKAGAEKKEGANDPLTTLQYSNSIKVVMEAVSKPRNISYKGTTDLVTDTDKRSETVILDVVRKNFVDHLILGEEGGLIGDTSSDYLWCIDPLGLLISTATVLCMFSCLSVSTDDGTTNFAHGYPSFAVSVGVLFRGRPAAAAVSRRMRSIGVFCRDLAVCVFCAVASGSVPSLSRDSCRRLGFRAIASGSMPLSRVPHHCLGIRATARVPCHRLGICAITSGSVHVVTTGSVHVVTSRSMHVLGIRARCHLGIRAAASGSCRCRCAKYHRRHW
ncbi:Phosphatase [Nymphaea thermarum]|nr:Phosphatase [Nymphaea thermarum]